MPSVSENTTSEHAITVYLPGRLPTARELVDFLMLLESSLVVGRIASVAEIRYDGESQISPAEWTKEISKLQRSFSDFIESKYDPLVTQALSLARYRDSPWDLLPGLMASEELSPKILRKLERLSMDRPYARQPNMSDFYRRKEFSGSDFNIIDFHEWIGGYFGNDLLQIQSVDPSGSIEFVFDLIAYSAILALQDYPTVKDSATYACGVLRGYMGKGKKSDEQTTIKLPTITPSMQRFMGQYDEVTYSADAKSGKIELQLKR